MTTNNPFFFLGTVPPKHCTVPWVAVGLGTLRRGCPGWEATRGFEERWGLGGWSGSGSGAWHSGSELRSAPVGKGAAGRWHPAGCSPSHLWPLTPGAGPSGCKLPSAKQWCARTTWYLTDVECIGIVNWIKCLSSLFETDLDSGCIPLQAPDGAAALVEGGLCLGMRWQSPEAHIDPQSLHYLLDEWGACIWKSLGHQADWEVKSHGQWLQVLDGKQVVLDSHLKSEKECCK